MLRPALVVWPGYPLTRSCVVSRKMQPGRHRPSRSDAIRRPVAATLTHSQDVLLSRHLDIAASTTWRTWAQFLVFLRCEWSYRICHWTMRPVENGPRPTSLFIQEGNTEVLLRVPSRHPLGQRRKNKTEYSRTFNVGRTPAQRPLGGNDVANWRSTRSLHVPVLQKPEIPREFSPRPFGPRASATRL